MVIKAGDIGVCALVRSLFCIIIYKILTHDFAVSVFGVSIKIVYLKVLHITTINVCYFLARFCPDKM